MVGKNKTFKQAPLRKPAEIPLIRLQNCSVILGGHRALDNVSFALYEGQRWALLGANGSGKTVFLKLLRGDVWPTPTGREVREYHFDGELSEQPMSAKARIAYVGPERQDKYVRYNWNHKVVDVVATGLCDEEIPRTRPSPAELRQINALLKWLGLWSLRRRGFLTLSYGQRRRALLARALASKPEILLLDEAFNGLDRTSTRILRRALDRKRGVGSTWVLTTHRAHEVPANVTHVARMSQGRWQDATSTAPVSTSSDVVAREVHKKDPRGLSRLHVSSRQQKRKNDTAPLLQLHNVDLYREYRLVLRDVNWTIHRGEHWAVVGANGSGKSTLLKLLYGDLHPKLGGSIERDGVPFGTPIAEWKARVGFVSPELQADYFLARDLEEVVISGRYSSVGLNDVATIHDRRQAQRWMTFFGIDALSNRKPRAVSYGQMRLALLARAMMNEPELLLLDEPCTGLDTEMRARVLSLLEKLMRKGVQLIVAVHDRNDVPRGVSKLLAIQAKGKVMMREFAQK